MGGAPSTKREKRKAYRLESQKKRDHYEDQGIDGLITVR
jgi:hypothetical protein